MGAVDNTSALQVGKGYSRVAFQLQKFNPLFTLVFTQANLMKFKVVENIPLSTAIVWSHCQKFKKFLTTLELKLGIIPNTVNSIAVKFFG